MNDRPHVAVYLALSLDGCIARDDGRLDWLESMQQCANWRTTASGASIWTAARQCARRWRAVSSTS